MLQLTLLPYYSQDGILAPNPPVSVPPNNTRPNNIYSGNIGSSSSNQILYLKDTYGGLLQTTEGYYTGAVLIYGTLTDSTFGENKSRIINYNYKGNDIGEFILHSPFPASLTQITPIQAKIPSFSSTLPVFTIIDPTDYTNSSGNSNCGWNPYIFVPRQMSRMGLRGAGENSLVNNYFYNVSASKRMLRMESRKCGYYNSITHVTNIETLGPQAPNTVLKPNIVTTGSLENWKETDLIEVRHENPIVQ